MFIGHSFSDADGTILSMDHAVSDMMERSRREIVGLSYLDLTHPADRVRNATMVRRLESDATPIALRKRYLTPDGGSVEMDVQVSRLREGPDAGRLIGTMYRVAPEDSSFAPEILWRAARRLAQLNELRRDLLGSELFADYAVSILLQVYLDEAEGRGSDVATIAGLVGLGHEGALRWLRALRHRALIEMTQDEGLVQLTETGARKVGQLLAANLD